MIIITSVSQLIKNCKIIIVMVYKIVLLIRSLLNSPSEFIDRIESIISSRLEKHLVRGIDYHPVNSIESIRLIFDFFKADISFEEIREFEQNLLGKMKFLENLAPFSTKHHGDLSLGRICYAICRLLNPEVVVETGVAYGVTTSYILKALDMNKKGMLYSIDLPPLGKNADSFVGYLVPNNLKSKWILYRGTSKRVLPNLLPILNSVDVFVHDSLHTYWNIRRELKMITPYLSRPSAVIADDIHGNRAFMDWIEQSKPNFWLTFKEEKKESVGGVAIFK